MIHWRQRIVTEHEVANTCNAFSRRGWVVSYVFPLPPARAEHESADLGRFLVAASYAECGCVFADGEVCRLPMGDGHTQHDSRAAARGPFDDGASTIQKRSVLLCVACPNCNAAAGAPCRKLSRLDTDDYGRHPARVVAILLEVRASVRCSVCGAAGGEPCTGIGSASGEGENHNARYVAYEARRV